MIQSNLKIASKNYYSSEITSRIPVKVTLLTLNGVEGFGIIESLRNDENDIKKYITELEKSDNIKEIYITYKLKNEYWTRTIHELSHPGIHDTILECGSMSLLPIIIKNGVQAHTILTPTSELFSLLMKMLKQRFTDIKLISVTSKPNQHISDILTKKQANAFITAYKQGYYYIPKKTTLENLSEQVGIKRVAMGERLRRAEKKIFDYFFDQYQ